MTCRGWFFLGGFLDDEHCGSYNLRMKTRKNKPQAWRLVGSLALTCVLYVAAASAQTNSSANPHLPQRRSVPPARQVIKVPVNLVNVLFTVTNKKGRLIPNLTQDDFQLYEDGTREKIALFGRQSNLPLRIGVLIDTSNSIRPRLEFEKEAAIDFLNTVLRSGQDQAFLISFDVEPVLLANYTDDVGKLSDAIRSLAAGGGTGLFDALYYACQQKMLHFPSTPPYLRRVLIIVSDGQDNESQHSLDEALSMAQRAQAIIFCISTNRSGITDRGDKVLKYLASQTGGDAFFPFEASDLAVAFKNIATELRSQYYLGYYSRARDGAFHRIRIKALEKGLRLHAKAGYFAPAS
jgi:Ca-activated chloride channel family protein